MSGLVNLFQGVFGASHFLGRMNWGPMNWGSNECTKAHSQWLVSCTHNHLRQIFELQIVKLLNLQSGKNEKRCDGSDVKAEDSGLSSIPS